MEKRFPSKNFTWIDDIFPEEKEREDKQEEERIKDIDQVSAEPNDVKNVNVTEIREEETEDIPPPM